MAFLRSLRDTYFNSRIVNINLNILLAGFVSIACAGIIINLTAPYIEGARLIVLFSFIVDACFDFGTFALLHTLVHKKSKPKPRRKKRALLKDIANIQGHRIVLSVVFSIIAIGGHLLLMRHGVDRTHAFVISYGVALVLVRILHTWYGIKSGLFD